MFLAFFALLMFCGVVGVFCWLALRRVLDHMRRNPEAARLISQNVIAPLLMGKESQPEETSPKEQ
jgi:hypothetical protein